jgi:hypothetical protein
MNEYIEPGTIKGKNIVRESLTKDTLAKKIITSTNRTRFYVKMYRGKIVNPDQDTRDKDSQKWMLVSEEVYGLYTKFLRTGQVQFLTSAERKI